MYEPWCSYMYFWIPSGVNFMWAPTHWLKKGKRNHLHLIPSRRLLQMQHILIFFTNKYIYVHILYMYLSQMTGLTFPETAVYLENCWKDNSNHASSVHCLELWVPTSTTTPSTSVRGSARYYSKFQPSTDSSWKATRKKDLCPKIPQETSCPLGTRLPSRVRLNRDKNCRQD